MMISTVLSATVSNNPDMPKSVTSQTSYSQPYVQRMNANKPAAPGSIHGDARRYRYVTKLEALRMLGITTMTIAEAAPLTRRVTRSITRREACGTLKHDATKVVHAEVELSTEADRSELRQVRHAKYVKTVSKSRTPSINSLQFHLIQEELASDLYKLLVAAALWNRTKGSQARPVLFALLGRYPSPEGLAGAEMSDLVDIIRPIGLYNTRASGFLSFAQAWVKSPPTKHKRYRKLHYPEPGSGRDVGAKEVLDEEDIREGWEIAHLPSIGPYALDTFRIFHRDVLRGLAADWDGAGTEPGFEQEWKRVMPQDKELKAYVRWKWLKEGWIWDPSSGTKTQASARRMRQELAREESLSPELI